MHRERDFYMVRKKAKVAALLLASLMTVSSVGLLSGCNKKDSKTDEVVTIEADSVWYNSKKIKLESPYDTDDVAAITMNSAVYMDDCIYVLITGERNFDINEAQKNPDFNYNDYIISSIAKYDLDGDFLEEMEIFNDSGFDIMQALSMSMQNGKLKVMCMGGNANSGSTSNISVIVDPKTKEAKLEELDFDTGDLSFVEGSYDIGDSTVSLIFDYSGNQTTYKAAITNQGKIVKTVDLSKATTKQFDGISNVLVIDDDTLAFGCMGKENFTLELTVSTGEVTVAEKNMNTGGHYFETSQDGSSYAVDYEGIYGINDDLEPELLMDFSNTNINVSSIWGGSVALISDDKIVAFKQDYSNVLMPESYIFVFEKAEENPNVGKKILDVYSLSGSVSFSEAESVVKFNETNSDYFIKMSFANVATEDDESDYKNVNAVSDELMIDVMNGEGPDVILNAQGIAQFNTSAYFVDMASFIDGDNGLDKSKYFTNVLDASKTPDGGIYQLPITIEVDGIMALEKDVEAGRIGFSFDDYIEFVDKACNGKNPITQSQTEFVVSSIRSGVVPYIKDGKVDFNNDEFKAVAQFAKDNIFDDIEDDNDGLGLGLMAALGSSNHPIETYIASADSFTFAISQFHGDIGLYGYPAPTETGLIATVVSSASISSNLDEDTQNASWEFIKIMLDEEIQNREDYGLPINKASFKNVVQDAIDVVNNEYDMYLKMGISESMLTQIGMRRTDDSVGDVLFNATESITKVTSLDTAIAPIIEEEIDAYFVGQKSIDEVIDVINNRSQTVINERGSN